MIPALLVSSILFCHEHDSGANSKHTLPNVESLQMKSGNPLPKQRKTKCTSAHVYAGELTSKQVKVNMCASTFVLVF